MYFKKLKKKLLLSVLFSLILSINFCYADTVDTQLSREKIHASETINVSFTWNGTSTTPTPDFSVLNNDFEILSTNYGKAVNIINGVISTQTSWRLTLEPKKTGVLTIPEITFGNVKSAAKELTVEEANTNLNDQDSPVFIQAEVSTTTPYIQSQVLYKFKLFYQTQLQNPTVELPQVKDATLIQLGESNNYQTTIKGIPYYVVEKSFALFPEKVGAIAVPPSHFRALTYDENATIMNPFYITAPKPISLRTKEFTLTARKIPDNFQGSSWLPAKNVSLTQTWSNNFEQWDLNTPIIRTIRVEANGLRGDQIPDLSLNKIAGVDMYIDPPKRRTEGQSNNVLGVLEQKVTYIPSLSQSIIIPELKLDWWNLLANTNAVAKLDSMFVAVKANSKTTQSASPNNTNVAPKLEVSKSIANPAAQIDTTQIKSAAKIKTNSFYSSIWFWVAIVIFVIWLMTLWLIWIKRSVKNTTLKSLPEENKSALDSSMKMNDESFAKACEQGNATLAQHYLLSWATKQWKNKPLNLEKLSEMISDESFKTELKILEQAIYAKKITPWNGHALLAVYKKVQKQQKKQVSFFKSKNSKDPQLDPLPPLNL